MSISYTPAAFGPKDDLSTGNPNKLVTGDDFDTEFGKIQTAFSAAAPTASPTLTGTTTVDEIQFSGENGTLSHYDEGTFTPRIETLFGADSTSGTGSYIRIGDAIHCYVRVNNINTGSSIGSDSLGVYGLPFYSDRTMRIPAYFNELSSGSVGPVYLAVSAVSVGEPEHALYVSDGGTARLLTVADITSGSSDLEISFTYFLAG